MLYHPNSNEPRLSRLQEQAYSLLGAKRKSPSARKFIAVVLICFLVFYLIWIGSANYNYAFQTYVGETEELDPPQIIQLEGNKSRVQLPRDNGLWERSPGSTAVDLYNSELHKTTY